MKLRLAIILSLLVGIGLMVSGCTGSLSKKNLEASDLLIPLNVSEALKLKETEVVAYFQDRRAELERLGSYLLDHERVFGTRPVILQDEDSVETIQDPELRQFAHSLFREGGVRTIMSLNDDPSKSVDLLFDSEDRVYRQGIMYLSLPEMTARDPSKLSYVQEYQELGDGWYYYVFHYDKVKDEEEFRNLAWDKLSEAERNTVTTPRDEALVALEAGSNVGLWIEDRKAELVVSVQFHTELDGLLGPITMFFDPMTREFVGGNLRY